MKLTILQCVFISAVIAAAGLTTYFSQEKKTLNRITAANIEALAEGETGMTISCAEGERVGINEGGVFYAQCSPCSSYAYLKVSSYSTCGNY